RFGSGLLHLASAFCFRLIIGFFFLMGRGFRSTGLLLAIIRYHRFCSHFSFWLRVGLIGFANLLLGNRLVLCQTDPHQFFLLSRFGILFSLSLFGLLRFHRFVCLILIGFL